MEDRVGSLTSPTDPRTMNNGVGGRRSYQPTQQKPQRNECCLELKVLHNPRLRAPGVEEAPSEPILHWSRQRNSIIPRRGLPIDLPLAASGQGRTIGNPYSIENIISHCRLAATIDSCVSRRYGVAPGYYCYGSASRFLGHSMVFLRYMDGSRIFFLFPVPVALHSFSLSLSKLVLDGSNPFVGEKKPRGGKEATPLLINNKTTD